MSGLNLGALGGVNVRASGSGFTSNPPSTAGQAAFGPGYGAGQPSTTNALLPNDPFGVALWWAVGAIAVLLWIRHSLPG